MTYELPKLDYAYDALDPYVDAMTMEFHHSKHHAAYTAKFNDAIAGSALENQSLGDIFGSISSASAAVRNNGGGYYNHKLFWEILSPKGGGEPIGELAEAIKNDFGSFEAFKEKFTAASVGRFGSGWAWLVKTEEGLVVSSTPNQDNPLMDVAEVKGEPIIMLDVWEHAYYLKYQNRRPEYIDAFWNIVNWEKALEFYSK